MSVKDMTDVFHVVTGVQFDEAVAAAGDPKKEQVLLHEISSRASKPTLFIEVEKEKQQMDLFDSFKPWPWPL